jgi:prepilin-type N-terminal cleavage/methylation domain-containing protein
MWNNLKKNPCRRRGFTLIEVLTALFIIIVGVLGAYGLINQTLMSSSMSSMQLTAAYLGKEGIEIVKSIRDDNYLKIHYSEAGYGDAGSWMNGLAAAGAPVSVECSITGCGGDYSTRGLDPSYAPQKLKFDGNFYNYASGNDTAFSRTITVIPRTDGTVSPPVDYLEVRVEVKWSERGRSHSFKVQENIYNWWLQ